MAETVDAAVSRVYRAFKASPFFENTVFIWSSDHGEMKAEQNLFGKGVPWEASQRVPLKVVSKGRIAPGSSDDSQWIGGTDVSATILDYAEAGPVPGTDIAKSFRGLLEGQPATAQDYVVSESSLPDAAVSFRSKDTKSIFHLQPGGQMTAEYYDTSQDPWEKNNLASGGAEPPGLADHRAFLADYRTRVKYLPAYLAGIESGGFLRVKPKRPAAASS
jgi:arylsulfatase A-like enzyme